MSQSLKGNILERIDQLPEPALRELLDFVESLSPRSIQEEVPILSVAGILSGTPLTAEEIERELYGDGEPTQ
jgi:hypothetical protein